LSLSLLYFNSACTEIRGGQAGGISSLEYDRIQSKMNRVRAVARKRYPLAVDLVNLYKRTAGTGTASRSTLKSFIGHTRFATSSVNVVPELHPHEWCPFHNEQVWQLNQLTGKFDKTSMYTGVHITHNGDFDALKV